MMFNTLQAKIQIDGLIKFLKKLLGLILFLMHVNQSPSILLHVYKRRKWNPNESCHVRR